MPIRCPSCLHEILGEIGGEFPPWCPKCGADLRNRPETKEQGLAAGPKCFECGEPAERKCTQCDNLICAKHGGHRWLWIRVPPRGYRVTEQLICDECTPNPTWMKFSTAAAVVIMVVAGVAAFYFVMTLQRP